MGSIYKIPEKDCKIMKSTEQLYKPVNSDVQTEHPSSISSINYLQIWNADSEVHVGGKGFKRSAEGCGALKLQY